MLGVLGSAGAFTSIRWIGSRAHPLISVNYFAIWCTFVSFMALSLSKPLHLSTTLVFAIPSGVRQWSMLLFLGVCGFVAQFLLTKGLAAGGRGGGARATNMIYTNMLFAMALDKLVFGQSPGWWSLGGSGLILGSAILVAVQRQQDSTWANDDVGEVGVEEEEMGMLGGGEAERGFVDEDDEDEDLMS
jgi:drug/metabolite transporter (DMT)-like permease